MQLVPVAALGFTILSFWWIYGHRGRLGAALPKVVHTAVRGLHEDGIPNLKIQVPIEFYNTGAATLVITDLKLLANGVSLEWDKTLPRDKSFSMDPAPFSVQGRQTHSMTAEFFVKGTGAHDLRGKMSLAIVECRTIGRVLPCRNLVNLKPGEWRPLISFEMLWPEQNPDHWRRTLVYAKGSGPESDIEN